MDNIALMPLLLALGNVGVSVYTLVYNWAAYLGARRGTSRRSPILFIGPICAFVAAIFAVRAGLPLPPDLVWIPPFVVIALDPAGLPMLVGITRRS